MAFPSDYNWKVDITTDSTKVGSNETDFPYYFDLSNISSTDFWNNVQSDGGDLRVSSDSAGSTQLPLEVVSIDTGAQTGEIHFKDSTDSASNKTYYLWWDDNTGVVSQPVVGDTFGRNNVWTLFATVWHLNNGTDSTGNGNTLTFNGNLPTTTNGIIGQAQSLDGTGDYINSSGPSALTFPWTVTIVANLDNLNSFQRYITDGDSSGNSDWYMAQQSDGQVRLRENGASGGSANTIVAGSSTTGSYQHTVGVFNSGDFELYIDGTSVGTSTDSGTAQQNYNTIYIGARGDGMETLSGDIDEFRIANSRLSDNWVVTEDNNLLNNSTFWTIGTPENLAVETVLLDAATITYNAQAVTIVNQFNLLLESASITYNSQPVTIVNQRITELEPASITYNAQDITTTTGATVSLDVATISYNSQPVTIINQRITELESASLNYNAQDITALNQFILKLDSASITYNVQDIEAITIEPVLIDSMSVTYDFQDISLNVNFDQDVFDELVQARQDVREMFNEMGDTAFYQINTQTYDNGGQVSSVRTKQYPIKVMWESGTNRRRQINEIGEYASGEKEVHLLHQYEITENTIIRPALNDYIITQDGEIWEITAINDTRAFGGVIQYKCEVQKRNNDWN